VLPGPEALAWFAKMGPKNSSHFFEFIQDGVTDKLLDFYQVERLFGKYPDTIRLLVQNLSLAQLTKLCQTADESGYFPPFALEAHGREMGQIFTALCTKSDAERPTVQWLIERLQSCAQNGVGGSVVSGWIKSNPLEYVKWLRSQDGAQLVTLLNFSCRDQLDMSSNPGELLKAKIDSIDYQVLLKTLTPEQRSQVLAQ
jgi:hypothetical protein